jgi:hypothetical protein
MIGFLSKLKERWQSCIDPEKELFQKMWRLYPGRLAICIVCTTHNFFLGQGIFNNSFH